MEKLETGIINVGYFNELYTAGTIYPYPKNRGGKLFDMRRVKNYAANWDTASSGCAVLEKTDKGYMLRDFHNRAEALKRGIADGNIKKSEPLLVRVIPPGDGFSAYKKINSSKNHTSLEKYSNTDLCFGSQIEKIVNKSKGFTMEDIPNKFFHQMAYIIVDVKIKKRSEYAFRQGSSWVINSFKDSSVDDAPELVLNQAQINQIAQGMDYYSAVIDILSDSKITCVERIARSAQFFGYVMFDYLFSRKLGDVTELAEAVIKRHKKVDDLLSRLVNGNMEAQVEKCRDLLTALTT